MGSGQEGGWGRGGAYAETLWGHLRQVLINSGHSEPHTAWKVITDSDLTEALRFKRFNRGRDDDREESETGEESLWEAVVPPANLVVLPVSPPNQKKDPVWDGIITRFGKGKPTWLVVISAWSSVSDMTKKMVAPWDTVVLE